MLWQSTRPRVTFLVR
uniref:Uncharacterized protein n=1 Tax=Macrostomum lignano TaxID=282301 RepID=A0A1I8FHF9_9PLAT